MKKFSCLFMVLVFLHVFFVQITFAQEENATEIDLNKAITYGIEHSPQVKMAEYTLKQAAEKVKEARASFFPQFDATLAYTDSDAKSMDEMLKDMGFPIPDGKKTPYMTQFSLNQPLFMTPIYYQYKLANKSLYLRLLEYKEVKDNLGFMVINSYYQAVKAGLGVDIAKRSLEQAERNLKTAEVNYQTGLFTKNQVLQMELVVVNARQSLLMAENMYKLSLAGLKNIMGMPQQNKINIDTNPEIPVITSGFSGDISTVLLNERYDLKKIKVQGEMAELGVKMAKSPYYPTAFVSANYMTKDEAPSIKDGTTSFTIGLSWSYSIGGKTQAGVRSAENDLKKLLEVKKLTEEGAQFEIYQAYLQWKEAQERTGLTEKGLEVAKENYNFAIKRYEVGMGTSQEVKDSQLSFDQAELGALNAKFDLLLSSLKLKQALGDYNVTQILAEGGYSDEKGN